METNRVAHAYQVLNINEKIEFKKHFINSHFYYKKRCENKTHSFTFLYKNFKKIIQ